MWTLTLEVVGLGLVAAIASPSSVLAAIALVSMSRGVRRGVAFIGGRLLGIGVLAVLFILLHGSQDFSSRHTTPSQTVSVVEIVLGGLLVIVAASALRRRGERPSRPSSSKLLDRLDRSHWLLGVVAGVVMVSYTVTLAAGAEILKANVHTFDASLAALVFAVTSMTLVAVPVALALIAPERSAQVLGLWKAWLLANTRVVGLIALVVVGVFLVARGAYDLAA